MYRYIMLYEILTGKDFTEVSGRHDADESSVISGEVIKYLHSIAS